MPKNWKTYKLSEVAEIKYGKDHKLLSDGDIPVFGSGGIMRYADKAIYDKESILIPRKGTLSNLFYLDKPFWSVDTMFYTKISEGTSGKFLYYLLKNLNLASMNVGSAVPSLTTEVLNKVEINLPDLKSQKQIASILSSLDNKIELNIQMNQTLEAMAQAIFKEWFVNFNFPGFDGKLVNGLPKGWKMGTISEIYKTTSGGTPSRAKDEFYKDGKVKWVKSKELNGSFIFDTEEKITDDAVKNSSAKKVPRHSVLIAMYGATVGEYGVLSSEATCNQAICAIIPNDNYPYSYILEYIKINKEKIIDQASGSAQQNISQALIQRQEILIPPSEIVKSFHQIVDKLFERIESNLFSNQILAQTRDSLLPNLIAGKLEVKA
jgi:type I restriction enzyme S subunit